MTNQNRDHQNRDNQNRDKSEGCQIRIDTDQNRERQIRIFTDQNREKLEYRQIRTETNQHSFEK